MFIGFSSSTKVHRCRALRAVRACREYRLQRDRRGDAMLVYASYLWLRRIRRGRLERQRQCVCMLLLALVSLLYAQSGELADALRAFVQLTAAVAPTVMHRADAASGARVPSARFQVVTTRGD
jgi:hypothetical protein